jgi:phosphate starvation-inducible protein PhoH and related proteins
VARKIPRENAKRANRPNPREDRNRPFDERKNPKGYREEERVPNQPKKPVELLPRSVAQEDYCDALESPHKHIVFAMGPAGCGKTLLATIFALKGYLDGTFEKIIITRPAVSVDEKHGFLPGDLNKKMEPWMMPIMDVFNEYLSVKKVEKMIADGEIEIAPLGFMRGRTFKNAIVIGDEMQNSLPSQMKMLLTRIGENSRMIITGDLMQHDRGFETNGLKDFVDRLEARGSDALAVCRFDRGDVERHAVIEEILNIYGDDD